MLTLLERVAFALIRKYNPIIVCITGSVGKTSTKDAIAACLSTSFSIRKTPKNLNNEFGVPISIIGGFMFKEGFWALLKILGNGMRQLMFDVSFPKVLVIEVGAGKINEVKRISQWLKPSLLVVTNLPNIPSHLGVFGSKEKLIQEKKYLADVMDERGKLFVDIVGKNINLLTDCFNGSIIDVGSDIKSMTYSILYKYKDAIKIPIGMRIGLEIENSRHDIDFCGFLGTQNIQAIAIAKLVAQELNCTSEAIIQGLSLYKPEAGRSKILQGRSYELTIIDDSFNSSPLAVENSIDNFLKIERSNSQRKIAVLGDMFNLGGEAAQIHKTTAVDKIPKVDILLTVGDLSEEWQSFHDNQSLLNKHFKNSTNAAQYLINIHKSSDIILFKGGHLTRLEKAVKILAECSDADLVRQEEYWQKPEFELHNK